MCRNLDDLVASAPGADGYVTALYGSVDGARRAILGDFFRHGFDGSGADNFYDAGSCIDGRLTSAWNWCACARAHAHVHTRMVACGHGHVHVSG